MEELTMKKFLSALIAMTMIISCVATVAFADVSGITGTLTKADLTESQQTTAGVGDGQVGYILKLNLSNFGTLTSDGEDTGRKLQSLQLDLTFDHPENVVYMFGKSYKTPKPTGWKTKSSAPFTKKTTSPHYSIPSNSDDATALYPKDEGEVTSISAVYELYIVLTGDVVVSPVITGGIQSFDAGELDGDPENFENVALSNLALAGPAATVAVSSVTISGATAATVGDNVQLTAAVLPDNATDKTVTWTKVSGAGAVSSDGVVTATAAGDVVVKATAGGVDSANYTVSFAAAAPADIVPAAADKDTYSNASAGLKDAFGQDVTIDSSRSYGAAKFDNVVLDDGEYVYKVFATGVNKTTGEEETHSWDVVDGSVEITGANVSFIAIVRSATRTITSVVLKAFAK
jgi:uncharacterized protein YjdB